MTMFDSSTEVIKSGYTIKLSRKTSAGVILDSEFLSIDSLNFKPVRIKAIVSGIKYKSSHIIVSISRIRIKKIIVPLKLKFNCFVSSLSVSVVLPMSWDVCSLNEGITGVNWLHISIQSWRGPLHLCIAFCLAHNDGRCFLKI